MQFDQIETFLAVLTYGGFHKAAEALRVSQPAVSARIRALEESLGVTLFSREWKQLDVVGGGEGAAAAGGATVAASRAGAASCE